MIPLMEEDWRPIDEFPNYGISDYGRVRNEETDKILSQSRGKSGPYVSLYNDNGRHNRSVALLVARAFLPRPKSLVEQETFDTPINCDGDRDNNRLDNLYWRPRWFALQFHKQFESRSDRYDVPIIDMRNNDFYATCWDAAIIHGLLVREIYASLKDDDAKVWPTGHNFAHAPEHHITPSRIHAI